MKFEPMEYAPAVTDDMYSSSSAKSEFITSIVRYSIISRPDIAFWRPEKVTSQDGASSSLDEQNKS